MTCDALSCSLVGLAGLTFVIWFYLVALHHGFWRADQLLPKSITPRTGWPSVVALVPARDEAAVIGESLTSLLTQDYPGAFHVILVDDHSSDGTAAAAAAAAKRAGQSARLTVLPAPALAAGWSGKLWALNAGVGEAEVRFPDAPYLWLSDADIAQEPDLLRRLVAKAEDEHRVLVSLMAKLTCGCFWEKLLIPPFIYFFQKLYPFRAINDPKRRQAGAAGGCALVRRDALARAGGLTAMCGALIDDCTLGRLLKGAAPKESNGIWVGLSQGEARSLRPYDGLRPIWDMVARSAYSQLNYSPWLLAGTLIGMVLTYLAAPVIALAAWPLGVPLAGAIALAAWGVMILSFLPTLRLFGLNPLRAALLPLAALLYNAMTFSSAWRHWHGQGGHWKGRTQAGLEQGGASG